MFPVPANTIKTQHDHDAGMWTVWINHDGETRWQSFWEDPSTTVGQAQMARRAKAIGMAYYILSEIEDDEIAERHSGLLSRALMDMNVNLDFEMTVETLNDLIVKFEAHLKPRKGEVAKQNDCFVLCNRCGKYVRFQYPSV